MIVIIDYGVGNLSSVRNGFAAAGYAAAVSRERQVLEAAKALVLPGVGAFGCAMGNLAASGLLEALVGAVRRGVPLLGICVGMQMLFECSEEMGTHRGLELLGGRVVQFRNALKVPQIGWNKLQVKQEHPLLDGVKDDDHVYFVHSYYVVPKNPEVVLAEARYGITFPAVISRGNVFGLQFHPEKSSQLGLKILANFGRLTSCR